MTPDCVSVLILILLLVKARVLPLTPVESGSSTRSSGFIDIHLEKPVCTHCFINNKLTGCTVTPEGFIIQGLACASRRSLRPFSRLRHIHVKLKDPESEKPTQERKELNGRLLVDNEYHSKPTPDTFLNLQLLNGHILNHVSQQQDLISTNTSTLLEGTNTNKEVPTTTQISHTINWTTATAQQRENESLNANTHSNSVSGLLYGSASSAMPIKFYENDGNGLLYDKFIQSLDQFERKFYESTFKILLSNSPEVRRENGITFVQSGLLLYLVMVALSAEVDTETRIEIENCLGLTVSEADKIVLLKHILSNLPVSYEDLRLRWSFRLVLGAHVQDVSRGFQEGAAAALRLHLDRFNGTETPRMLANTLNSLLSADSEGAMHDTFDEDELTDGARTVFLGMGYLRGRWRASPTLLNGTTGFRDGDGVPLRTTRMIRINDDMLYADLTEWDAEAVQISYATPGLTLLVLTTRGRSLRALATQVASCGLRPVLAQMQSMRVAVTMPIYTLRMTLLLPNKLQAMGISRLVGAGAGLRLSHAVQRLMFWSEAGRNAFKDDGIEWEAPPERSLLLDRPYLFFVRWHGLTLFNGNFVL